MQPTACDVRANHSPPISLTSAAVMGAVAPPPRDAEACIACSASAMADAQYAQHAFGMPQRLTLTAESIADCLGYCAAHARQLAVRDEFSAPIRAALDVVLDRWRTWLGDESIYGDRVRELFFHVDHDCAACRFAEHHAARAVSGLERVLAAATDSEADGRVGRLCFPHFKLLYVGADAATRETLLPRYRATLSRAIERHLTGDDALTPHVHAGGPAPRIAGTLHRHEADALPGAARTSSPQRIELPELLADRGACAVCRLVAAAHARWVQTMFLTLRTGQPAWLSFPSCAVHVHVAAALGDDAIARTAARHAAEVALSALERRVPPFTPPIDSENETPDARRIHRRRVRRGVIKPAPRPRMSSCTACERAAVARDAAIDGLLDLLRAGGHRANYAHGYGLCMRHFARAYLFADRRTIRPFLVDVQRERLAQAHRELDVTPIPGRADIARALARLNGASGAHAGSGMP